MSRLEIVPFADKHVADAAGVFSRHGYLIAAPWPKRGFRIAFLRLYRSIP